MDQHGKLMFVKLPDSDGLIILYYTTITRVYIRDIYIYYVYSLTGCQST